MNEISLLCLTRAGNRPRATNADADATPAVAGEPVDMPGVKRWRRWLTAGVTLGLVAVLGAPTALAQGAPGQDQEDEEAEEESAPAPPPPKPKNKKKKAPAPPAAAAGADQGEAKDAPAKDAGKDAPAKDAGKDAKDAKKDKEASVEERALRGVVVIERGGQVVGLGGVLGGDGRILTALSSLGHGNNLEVRYADGSVVRVKVGHHDRVWDLALLVPQTGKWKEGLTASLRDPVRQDAQIRSFSAVRGKTAALAVTLRGHRTLLGGDDRQLENVLELSSRIHPQDLGAPLIDEEGRVVGILGRGCAPSEGGKPCTPVAFGAPMSAVKSFLRTVPPTAVQPSGWLGIQGVGEAGPVAKGVRVTSIHPDSPAAEAQLKGGDKAAGDMILAVDGVPVTTPEALAEAIRTHAVGEKVPLMVFGADGKYRQVIVALRTAPDPKAAPGAAPAHPAELPPLAPAPRRQGRGR